MKGVYREPLEIRLCILQCLEDRKLITLWDLSRAVRLAVPQLRRYIDKFHIAGFIFMEIGTDAIRVNITDKGYEAKIQLEGIVNKLKESNLL